MSNRLNVKISSIRKKHSWIIDSFLQGETYFEFQGYCKERSIDFDSNIKDRLIDAITPCEDCVKLTKAKQGKVYNKEFDREAWKYRIEQDLTTKESTLAVNNSNVDFTGEVFYFNY